MPATASALMSLLPVVGAVALVGQGARRLLARRGRPGPGGPVQMPKEPVAAEPRRMRRKAVAEATCTRCGTSVPAGETVCALCTLETAPRGGAGWSTAASWLAVAAGLGALLGAAWMIGP